MAEGNENTEQPEENQPIEDSSKAEGSPKDEKVVFQLAVMFTAEPNTPNSKVLPSTLTFEIKPELDSVLQYKKSKEQIFASHIPTLTSQLVGPSKENQWEYSLTEMFEMSQDYENVEFFMRSKYFSTPYSEAKNIPLSEPIEQKGQLLVGLEKNENGEWLKIKGNKNIICD